MDRKVKVNKKSSCANDYLKFKDENLKKFRNGIIKKISLIPIASKNRKKDMINIIFDNISGKKFDLVTNEIENYLKEFLPEDYDYIMKSKDYSDKTMFRILHNTVSKIDKYNINDKCNEFIDKFGQMDFNNSLVNDISNKDKLIKNFDVMLLKSIIIRKGKEE